MYEIDAYLFLKLQICILAEWKQEFCEKLDLIDFEHYGQYRERLQGSFKWIKSFVLADNIF